MSSSPVVGPEMQQRYKFAQSVVALGPGTSASKTILLYEWLCAHLATKRSHGQTELFESQTHMWRLKSPKLAGQDMFGKTWQPRGRSIPPVGRHQCRWVCSCILSCQTGRILEDSQGFDNDSAAPSTNIFFPVSIS